MLLLLLVPCLSAKEEEEENEKEGFEESLRYLLRNSRGVPLLLLKVERDEEEEVDTAAQTETDEEDCSGLESESSTD